MSWQPSFPGDPPTRRSAPGVALVVTLMMMSVLTMMVVGLAGVMRNEQAAARNLTYLVLADQIAELGVNEAMATVLQNSPAGGATNFFATAPGQLYSGGNVRALFSSNGSGATVNLERMGTNSLILSTTNPGQNASLLASWSNLVAPGDRTNMPVGRYAWWVDDEASKGNLNFLAGSNPNLFPSLALYPFAAGRIFTQTNLLGNRMSNLLAGRSNWFFSVESLKDTNAFFTGSSVDTNALLRFYHANKGQITAWASNVEFNPWGQAKATLSQLTNPAAITNNSSFGTLMSNTFAHPNLPSIFGPGRDFVAKYGGGQLGSNIIRQTLANAYEALQPTNATNPPLTDATGTNMPTNFLAVSPRTAHFNEIPVAVTYHGNTNATPNRLQLQIWVLPEILSPRFPTSGVDLRNLALAIQMSSVTLQCQTPDTPGGSLVTRDKTNFWSNTDPASTVTNGSLTTLTRLGNATNPNTVPGFYTNRTWVLFEYTFRDQDPNAAAVIPNAGYATNLEVTVRLGRTTLYQRFGQNWRVADWLDPASSNQPITFSGNTVRTNAEITNTFAGAGNVRSMAASTNTAATLNPPAGITYRGFSKNDPRVRAFPGWTSAVTWSAVLWRPLDGTPGAENQQLLSGSVPLGLSRDTFSGNVSATNQGAVWFFTNTWTATNTNQVSSWGVTGSNFPSVGALGQIHVGLPWRTLRMASQGSDPNPPDWFLAELFTASTNPTAAAPRLNLNHRITHLGGTTNRRASVASLFENLLLATNTILAATNRWTSNGATSLDTAPGIPWIASSGEWQALRSTRFGPTLANLFVFPGEILEVEGIGNVGTSDEQRESAALAVFDMVTTRSDTFSVWSIGQAMAYVTNSSGNPTRTNFMSEMRRQTVFQRIPVLDGNGNLLNYQIQPVYNRHHAME